MFLWVSALSQAYAQQENDNHLTIFDDFKHRDVTEVSRRVYADQAVTFSTVQAHLDQWLPMISLSPIPSNAKIWARLSLSNRSYVTKQLTIVASNPNAQNVEGYVVDEQGNLREVYTRSVATGEVHFVEFELAVNETLDVYIGVQSDGPTYLPLSVWDSDELAKRETQEQLQQTLFLGALGGLIGYFFITYFVQRNVARFWFAVTGALALIFALKTQGVSITPLDNFFGYIDLIVFIEALTLLAATKVTHYLFLRIPVTYKWTSFAIPVSTGLICLLSTVYLSFIVAVLGTLSWLSLQIYCAMKFRDRRHVYPALFYIVGMCIVFVLAIFAISRYAMEIPPVGNAPLFLYIAVIFAIIFAGIAIEISERGIRIREFSNQEKRIENLRQFYELFRNSAEGLYTSTLDGQLLSVNTAMCQLFGYPDEAVMLSEASTTTTFYAHPEDRELLLEDLLNHQRILGREIRGRRRDGGEFWFSISCQIHREGNKEYLYGSIFDITEKKQSSLSLEYLATHDSLTGVLNRREFERQLEAQVKQHEEITLLFLDLDRFKLVNDSCGHQAGDELIKEIANLIHNTVSKNGHVARLGGDEFAVLFKHEDVDAAYVCANKLLQAIQDYKFFYENRMFTLGVSIGFLNAKDATLSTEQLLSMADAACYIAKEHGRNQIHRYSPDDESVKRYESELNWLNKINDALQRNRFVLYYQPYQPLNKADAGLYAEILVRLLSDDGQPLSPGLFLPTVERYNMGAKIDRWVIENTFEWLALHPEIMDHFACCNVNLSGQSLANKELKLAILNAFEKFSIPYEKICFEITETTAVVRLEETLDFIKTFRQLGSRFALDDFGSGFSSYSYLKTLPVDCVKIDGSFIRELLRDPVSQAMVCSMNDVAKAMKMQTVAEFVEDDATLTELGRLGIDFAQGYAVAKPLPLDSLVNQKQ